MCGVTENMVRQQPAPQRTPEPMQPEILSARVVSDNRFFRRSSALVQLLFLIAILGIIAGIVIAGTIGGTFGLIRHLGGVDPTATEQSSSSSTVSTPNIP